MNAINQPLTESAETAMLSAATEIEQTKRAGSMIRRQTKGELGLAEKRGGYLHTSTMQQRQSSCNVFIDTPPKVRYSTPPSTNSVGTFDAGHTVAASARPVNPLYVAQRAIIGREGLMRRQHGTKRILPR